MNHANTTLGELLSSKNEIVKRNAFSILKQLVKEDRELCEEDGGAHFWETHDNGIDRTCRKCLLSARK